MSLPLHRSSALASVPSTAAASAARRRARAGEPLAVATKPPSDDYKLSVGVRRWIYKQLEPIDQGDFRWEFLVPFNNKTLTTLDKFIVCSAFVGVSFTAQTLFDPGASVGVHLSYIAQFFSYAMGDPIGFRSLAVLTSILEIAGNLFETKEQGMILTGVDFNLANAFANINEEDVFPILYDQLFIVINGYYIVRWLLGQEVRAPPHATHPHPHPITRLCDPGSRDPPATLPCRSCCAQVLASALEWEADQEELYSNCFAPLGFRRAQFTRLLRSSTVVRADEAVALTVQDQPVLDLFVPLNGTIEVRVGGAVASTLPPYQLVGEASLLENLQSEDGSVHPPARATVVATAGSYYVRWPQSAFYELQQEEDSDFGYAIQLMIARTLSSKLSAARLSQRESEQRLKGRVSATFRGASPRTLAAARLGGEGSAGGARTGEAVAEVTALISQNEGNRERIQRLEKTLRDSERELSDLKLITTFLVSLVLTQLAFWSLMEAGLMGEV